MVLRSNFNQGKAMAKKTQIKLSGRIGICPVHLSDVKVGKHHLSGKKARVISKVTKSDLAIWMAGASKADIKKRGEAINSWCQSKPSN